MAAVMKHWREAATLILISRSKFLSSASTSNIFNIPAVNYDVLMLKRSAESPFMPNAYVFPGGVADDADFSSDWLKLFTKIGNVDVNKLTNSWQKHGRGAPMFARNRDAELIPSELAFRICAIRETFEECGILLAKESHFLTENSLYKRYSKIQELTPNSAKEWRKRITKDASEFVVMCEELNVLPDVWCLYEWSNWLTPVWRSDVQIKVGRRRFDTAFYLAVCDEPAMIIRDERETSEALWTNVTQFLQESMLDMSVLRTPQFYEFGRLLNFADIDQLLRFCSEKTTRVDRLFSVFCNLEDGMLMLLPGDSQYPDEPDFETQTVLNLNMKLSDLLNDGGKRHYQIIENYQASERPQIGFYCSLDTAGGSVPPNFPFRYSESAQSSKL